MGRRQSRVTDKQIIASYKRTHSMYATARDLQINWKTVQRALFLGGVQATGLEHWRANKKFKGQESKMRIAYENGMTLKQIAEKFGAPSSLWAAKAALKRVGTELRENPASLVQDDEVERIRELYANGYSQQQIAILMERSQPFVSRIMRKHAITTRVGTKGETHPNWQGGRSIDTNGYVQVWLDENDPMAVMCHHDGKVLEHRLVMARKIGRPLTRRETVHHKDGDRANNELSNLQLRHGKHGKGVRMCCLNCGSYDISVFELD